MFLTRLSELYDRLDTQPSGYELKPTRWVIQLSEDGTWLPPMAETDSLTLSVPTRKRSSNVAPCLFADDPHFILGARVGDDDMEQDKIQERYQSHLALVEECAEQTRDPLVAAAVRFLRESSVEARESVADTGMKPKDFLTIRVGQTFLVELESVRRFWQTKLESETAGKSVFRSQCI
ncbi:MAG: type I-C CRISPR-associated protein Cas8c/Csd1, partial [Candidatus Poribacteria bacterium]|nr:type I-C CRISPR-associated protein Cas8c/Csd1 [Candidatus Poribacteria bacterium]